MDPTDKHIRIWLLAAALVLLAGGGYIYIAYRSDSLVMFGWFDRLGLMPLIQALRTLTIYTHPSSFVLYSLPDALWLAAYLLIVNALYYPSRGAAYVLWVLALPLMAIVHEVLQGLHIVSGVFDVADLSCYIIILSINLIYIFYEKFI